MKGAIQAIRALVTDRCGAIGFVLHGFPFFVAFLPEFGGISFERCHDNAFDPISSFIRNTIKCFQSVHRGNRALTDLVLELDDECLLINDPTEDLFLASHCVGGSHFFAHRGDEFPKRSQVLNDRADFLHPSVDPSTAEVKELRGRENCVIS